ncbi:hypothetical protein J23TS9_44800 [Paenibacillus sp. J23TS9]|uniref:hypothetical protein n=1 Tax=Paenibacillus sp. J23TS9 TaxID=2807193 RepID=UPI001B0D26B1|nr:hypothetical protein [Paenibacillus sp. J23TS9]GIP29350.1 hypothetical protein J23TS9_44800 [Paenibacillus sp. J23TS9]
MNSLQQAGEKLIEANLILNELDLLNLWSAVGEPVLVGAAAYNLIFNRDIDMEIYCDQPEVASGFRVLESCVKNPKVIGARYSNHLDGEDQGIYFQLRYKYENDLIWKIDMWLLAHDHPGPCAKDLVEPLNRVLTDESRESILTIKNQIAWNAESIASIRIYEAVIDYNIQTYKEFMEWHSKYAPKGLTSWKPKAE